MGALECNYSNWDVFFQSRSAAEKSNENFFLRQIFFLPLLKKTLFRLPRLLIDSSFAVTLLLIVIFRSGGGDSKFLVLSGLENRRRLSSRLAAGGNPRTHPVRVAWSMNRRHMAHRSLFSPAEKNTKAGQEGGEKERKKEKSPKLKHSSLDLLFHSPPSRWWSTSSWTQ